jgi:hypothetical protein
MKLALLMLLCAALYCFSSPAEARVRFPKEKDFNQFRKVCAGGEVAAVRHRVDEALKEWKSDVSATKSVESARSNLGAVMEKITPDAGGNALYEKYVSCVRNLVENFLIRKNPARGPVNPGSGVDGFLTLGVTYGSIRTGDDDLFTNDNRMIGLARVGWWFNEHIAVGLEGSYWQAEAKSMEIGGQRIQHMTLGQHGAMGERLTNKDSGIAFVAGAGFEFAWTPNVSVSILARGIRTEIEAPPEVVGGERVRQDRDVLSVGVALSFH